MYYCFKLICAYLNEGDYFCECYKNGDTSPFTFVFLQYFSSNVDCLNSSIYLSNCCNQGQLLNKKVIMKCLNSKNIIATLRIVTIEKLELTFLLILYFHAAIKVYFKNCILRNFAYYNFCWRLTFQPLEEDWATSGLFNVLNGINIANLWPIYAAIQAYFKNCILQNFPFITFAEYLIFSR